MILDLFLDGDPILSETLPIFDFEAGIDLVEIMRDMSETMIANSGAGLAANQVGLRHRLFLMRDGDDTIMCVNPVLLDEEGTEWGREGCLSFPDLHFDISRPPSIDVQFYDQNGEIVERSLYGFAARVFQHELDHINGVVFTSKVSKLKLQMAKAKRKKALR